MTLWGALLPLAVDNADDGKHGVGGWGALIVLLMIGASVGLFLLMRRSLGRVRFVERPDPRDRAPQPGSDDAS